MGFGVRATVALAIAGVGAACCMQLAACGSGSGGAGEPDAGTLPEAGATVFDGGGEAAVPPNGALLCPSGPCNYQTRAGCIAIETCWPVLGEDGGVGPLCQHAGILTSGSPCREWVECAPGLICIDGACRHFCCGGDWSVCATNESCIRTLELDAGATTLPTGVGLCHPVNECDVLDPASCSDRPGQTCQIVDPRGSVACMPEGDREIDDPCTSAASCTAGLFCIGDRCRRLCRAVEGGEPACRAGEGACVHYTRDPEGVGECTQLIAP